MAVPNDERLVVETPAARRWRLAGLGMIMTGAAAAVAVTRTGGLPGLVAGLLALAFFGPLTLTLLVRAIRRTPPLILGADGFTDHATAAGAGFVRWQDVLSIDEQAVMGRVFVTVTMADRAAFRRGLPAWRRCLLWLNQRLVTGDVFIPDSVLPMRPADLVRQMRALRRAAAG